jgi:hypothetical protein
MGRPLRITCRGAHYHITARVNERKDIFKSRRDREQFLAYLESSVTRYSAVSHAYCLMNIFTCWWRRRMETNYLVLFLLWPGVARVIEVLI